MPVSRRMWEGVQGASPCQHSKSAAPLNSKLTQHKKVSVFRVNQLLSAAGADDTEGAGVRYANANNRGANTNANYGFPLYMPFHGISSANRASTNNNKRNTETLPHRAASNGSGKIRVGLTKCW